jgi:uncharacterized surface protein with fasciclin (FAS1) repeats
MIKDAHVGTSDIEALNDVIHVFDRVIVPSTP